MILAISRIGALQENPKEKSAAVCGWGKNNKNK